MNSEMLFVVLPLLIQLTSGQTISADSARLCEASSITSCAQCVSAHPDCAWCASVSKTDQTVKRCRRFSDFRQSGTCQNLQYPISEKVLLRNDSLSSAGALNNRSVVQLQPQEIQVNIRNGDTVKFNVTFRKVTDYPVDLYYLMDLSYSMNDDLETLQSLGQQLADNIQKNVTQDIQMGFGTFVDKVLLPFTSTVPDQLKNPCINNAKNNICAPPFDFRHQLPMTADLKRFRDSVNETRISGNIDTPEGLFDALMQIAVCGNKIGWRNDSSHLVVITTDAPFHMALDGKLASIFEANDMTCHLMKGANDRLPNDTVYDKSKVLDYPSIGQLRAAFARSKIQPIFAVTKDVQALYEELRSLIPNSYVDQLAADSRNIISIIQSAYNKLRGRLDMTLNDQIPPEIQLTHRTLCPGSTTWSSSLSCDKIQIGSEITYEFSAKATKCRSSNPTSPLLFTSSSLQEDVKISFNFLCSCNCSLNITKNSLSCNKSGSLSCGICVCNDGFEGPQCQCERKQSGVSLSESCKMPNNTDAVVCGGHGQCVCGKCVCNEGYFRKYCECSNIGCAVNGDGICGGPKKGTCEHCDGKVAKCICHSGYSIDTSLDTCTCNPAECSKDNQTCSGRGTCNCNRCECDKPHLYTGTHCETCISPDCNTQPRSCSTTNRVACAQCVSDVQRRRENVAKECLLACNGTKYEIVTKIPNCESCTGSSCPSICSTIDVKTLVPQPCQSLQLNSQCALHYKLVWSQNNYLLLVKEYNKAEDCAVAIDPLVIILPIVGGIVLVGIIGLIAWKIYQTIRDKREWVNFENEKKKSNWTKGQNPIFEAPSSRFENPMYQGGN